MANGKMNLTNNFGETTANFVRPLNSAVEGDVKPDFQFGSGACLFSGEGVPDFEAPAGSVYFRTDGANANEVIYVNFAGNSTWTAK